MKVLHVGETIKGGVATVINELIKHQANDKEIKKITCLIPDSQRNQISSDFSNIETFHRTGRNFKSIINLSRVFKQIIKDSSPEIIHLHSSFAGFICRVLLIFSKSDSKVIYCPHAFSFLMNTHIVKKTIFIVIEYLLQFFTEKIICVSTSEMSAAVKYGIRREKMIVIHNGVSDDHIGINNERFNNYSDEINVLYVGRLDYQKGFDLLIRAIESLNRNDKKITFRIIGDYVGEKKTVDLDIDGVIFLGWLDSDSISRYYLSSDLLVMPSRWEGFAMVPIEAFMHGVPVLASNISSVKEIVDDGVNGILFESGDYLSLSNKLSSLSKIELFKLKNNARKTYEDKFTSSKMYREVISLYKKVMNG